MKECSLNINTTKEGVYLSQQQIDLLTLVSCKDYDELKDFMCGDEEKNVEAFSGQFPTIKRQQLTHLNGIPLEEAKRKVFKAYQDSLISYLDNNNLSQIKRLTLKLKCLGISQDDITTCLGLFKEKKIKEIYSFLEEKYGEKFVNKANHYMVDDFENIKSATYEQFVELDRRIRTNEIIDTIIVATGKYDNVMMMTKNGEKFDPYFVEKGLKYCKDTGKHMRYHSLFDTVHAKKLIAEGKTKANKEEILESMKCFVEESINFIARYNEENTLKDNSKVITTLEIFNELIEYNKEEKTMYEEIWKKYFDISIDEMISIIKSVEKPSGVKYMYNETMLEESPLRLKKVEDEVNIITSSAPGLIDVFGDQLHLASYQVSTQKGLDIIDLKNEMLKRIQNNGKNGLKIEITEADMHIDDETYRKIELRKQNGEIDDNQVQRMLNQLMSKVGQMIEDKGIKIDRATYWTLIPNVDHNLVRSNLKYNREEIKTLYSGKYYDITPDNKFLERKEVKVERPEHVHIEKKETTPVFKKTVKEYDKTKEYNDEINEMSKELNEELEEYKESKVHGIANIAILAILIILIVIVAIMIVMSIIYK